MSCDHFKLHACIKKIIIIEEQEHDSTFIFKLTNRFTVGVLKALVCVFLCERFSSLWLGINDSTQLCFSKVQTYSCKGNQSSWQQDLSEIEDSNWN